MKYSVKENTRKNPGEDEIFRTRPDRPWGPPNFLYYGYRVSFLGVNRPGRDVNHPPPFKVLLSLLLKLIFLCVIEYGEFF